MLDTIHLLSGQNDKHSISLFNFHGLLGGGGRSHWNVLPHICRIVVDKISNGSITHLRVSLVWGMAAMIIVYSIYHICGGHLNPAVTLALAAVERFPWVPAYIVAQVFASISVGFTLRFMFGEVAYTGATVPSGSKMQSFVPEIITTSLLVVVVSAVATDTKAVDLLNYNHAYQILPSVQRMMSVILE